MDAPDGKYDTPYELGRIETVDSVLPRGPGRALDIGCGPGIVSALLRKKGFEVTGIDIDAGALATARAQLPDAAFLRLDVLTDALPDGPFQVVTACEVIEHFDRSDQRRILREIDRVLAPDGHLIVSTPNTLSLMSAVGSVAYPFQGRRWDCGDATHRDVHNANSLRSTLAGCGFVIQRQRGFQLLLHKPWALARFGMRAFDGRLSGLCYSLIVDAVRPP
jgi:2-polyprenyl-3-methyl-5-hydroxy-6-metoxy-1,4-benzoquinol methylase